MAGYSTDDHIGPGDLGLNYDANMVNLAHDDFQDELKGSPSVPLLPGGEPASSAGFSPSANEWSKVCEMEQYCQEMEANFLELKTACADAKNKKEAAESKLRSYIRSLNVPMSLFEAKAEESDSETEEVDCEPHQWDVLCCPPPGVDADPSWVDVAIEAVASGAALKQLKQIRIDTIGDFYSLAAGPEAKEVGCASLLGMKSRSLDAFREKLKAFWCSYQEQHPDF